MTQSKHAHPFWQKAAACLLALSLLLPGIPTAHAAGGPSILLLSQFGDGAYPAGLIYGPGQSLWVSLSGAGEIGQISGSGMQTHPLGSGARPYEIITGPDQALWFSMVNQGKIGRLDVSGSLSEFTLSEGSPTASALALGQDLALWFTEPDANRIGRLAPSGEITRYDLPGANSRPISIISGLNGELWFVEWGSYRIGKITPEGKISEYDLPSPPARPTDLLVGPDGCIWVIYNTGKTITRFDPQAERFNQYSLPTKNASLFDLTIGPDNRIWFIGTHTAGSFELANGAPANLTEEDLPAPIYAYQGRSQITAGPDNDLIFITANSSDVYRWPLGGTPALRDLQLFITHLPSQALAAGSFYIDAEIVNWTNTAATGLEITLTLDENIHFESANPPEMTCTDQGALVRCSLPVLGAGERLPVTFAMSTGRLSAGAARRAISLEVSSAEGDYQPANNRVVIPVHIQSKLEYFNDFSQGADDRWSHPVTSKPVDGLDVLGLFDNDGVTFEWAALPPHDRADLCFDLYIMGPWSGSQFEDQTGTIIGPDLWTSYVNDQSGGDSWRQLTLTTFSNQEQYRQAYPAEYREGLNPAQARARLTGDFDGHPETRDAVYTFCYQIRHSSPSFKLLMKGLNLDDPGLEKWAVDNVWVRISYAASFDQTYLPIVQR